MIRTQISLTEEQAQHLRMQAAAQGVSQAAVVRRALDEYLANSFRAAHIERARSAFGAFRSGCGDLADNHDAYLEDALRS